MHPSADIYTDFSRLAGLKRQSRQDKDAALREAAKQFEAVFVQMLLKQMRQASPGDPTFTSNRSRFYRDMYDQQLALQLADQGSIGIADLLVAQLGGPRPAAVPVNPSLGDYRTGSRPDPIPPPPDRFESARQFIQTLWPEAQSSAARIGLDPKLLLAQAALETGWGKKIIHHPDGRSSHNLFNIKAGRGWRGERVRVSTLEYQDGVAVRKQAAFRAYPDYRQSFEDYLALLTGPRYAEAIRNRQDPRRYLEALQQAGYATDPHYADKILAIYQREILASR